MNTSLRSAMDRYDQHVIKYADITLAGLIILTIL
jgi:hypothetical protein